MSKPIAIFYHCVLSGPRIPNEDHALAIMQSQMHALKQSGLGDELSEFHIGVNGSAGDCLEVLAFAPAQGSIPQCHQFKGGQSELSTLSEMQKWLKPGWLVMYHHIKGVTRPDDFYAKWRNCMESACVWRWRECVKLLESGLDTVGAHWLYQPKFPVLPGQRYWGGNFWWATSDYLLTLPPLPTDTFENRYEAETWIGKSPRPPLVHDFAPHWPMQCP